MSFRQILILSGLGLVPFGLAGQTAEAPLLSLAVALEHATTTHPALLARSHRERAADALIEQAGLRPNPSLDLGVENAFGTGALQGLRGVETTLEFGQVVERGGKLERRLALAESERAAVGTLTEVQRWSLRAYAAAAYVEAVAAAQRAELAAEPLRLARESLEAVEARIAAAVASPAELARARATEATARAAAARAEAAFATARAQLAATWAGPPESVSALPARWSIPDALPDRSEFLANLMEHPSLTHQEATVAGRRAAVELEQAQAVPDISVGGGVRFLREGSDVALVAGVSMPLPFRNRNQGAIRAAIASVSAAQADRSVVELELRTAFVAAWQELVATHAAVQTLRGEAVPAAEAARQAVSAAYDAGQLPLIDVLDTQRALADLRAEVLETEAAFAAALVRVCALADPDYAAVRTFLQQP